MNQLDPGQLEKRLIRIIIGARNVDPDTVTSSTTLEQLEIRSYEAISMAFEIQGEFGIEITDDELFKLRTVGDVINGVQRLLKEKQGADKP